MDALSRSCTVVLGATLCTVPAASALPSVLGPLTQTVNDAIAKQFASRGAVPIADPQAYGIEMDYSFPDPSGRQRVFRFRFELQVRVAAGAPSSFGVVPRLIAEAVTTEAGVSYMEEGEDDQLYGLIAELQQLLVGLAQP